MVNESNSITNPFLRGNNSLAFLPSNGYLSLRYVLVHGYVPVYSSLLALLLLCCNFLFSRSFKNLFVTVVMICIGFTIYLAESNKVKAFIVSLNETIFKSETTNKTIDAKQILIELSLLGYCHVTKYIKYLENPNLPIPRGSFDECYWYLMNYIMTLSVIFIFGHNMLILHEIALFNSGNFLFTLSSLFAIHAASFICWIVDCCLLIMSYAKVNTLAKNIVMHVREVETNVESQQNQSCGDNAFRNRSVAVV